MLGLNMSPNLEVSGVKLLLYTMSINSLTPSDAHMRL